MDILSFAINMELEGSKYYSEQAKECKDADLRDVFLRLSEDEEKHAQILEDIKSNNQLSADKINKSEAYSVFADKAKRISEITFSPEQLDVYRFALDKETESIELYKELKQKSKDNENIYDMIIDEEKKHFEIISNVVELLEKPKQWVESAEFGIREDY